MQAPTISIVIPVFNEASHIKHCLEAIQRQTVRPTEVIVVDNNCTDETVAIAETFAFVTVLQEPRQGLIAARNTGCNAAVGDILLRIDADTVLEENALEEVQKAFMDDQSLAGLSGIAYISWFSTSRLPRSTLASRSYYWFAEVLFRGPVLWGACMAVRSDDFRELFDQLSTDDEAVHEDQDISLVLAKNNKTLAHSTKLRFSADGQTYRYFPKILYYGRLMARTRRLHLGYIQGRRIPVWAVLRFLASIMPLILLIIIGILLYPVDRIRRRR